MLELTWSPGLPLPVWIAGYGPVALKLTGRIADGSMLQIGDPDLIRWFASQVRDSAVLNGETPPRSGSWPPRRPTSASSPTAAIGPAGSRRSSATTSWTW